MTATVFENATLFDGENPETPDGMHVLVADGRIEEISLLTENGRNLSIIMRDGQFVRRAG